jgi:predicted regulator of Ras-like GTPase activity (Roadblock/LC7/MglB family)
MNNVLNMLMEQIASELPGFEASAVIEQETSKLLAVCCHKSDTDVRSASARAAAIVQASGGILECLTGGRADGEVLFTTQDHHVLVRRIPSAECFLFIMIRRDDNRDFSGQVLEKYREQARELTSDFSDAEIWFYSGREERAC